MRLTPFQSVFYVQFAPLWLRPDPFVEQCRSDRTKLRSDFQPLNTENAVDQPDSLPPTVARTLCRLLVAGKPEPLLIVDCPQSITIGRDAQCQLQLDQDPSISRFHCRLEITTTSVRVIDLGGRNGTFLNQVRITESNLRDGDELSCGQTRMRVEITLPEIDTYESTIIRLANPETNDGAIPSMLGRYEVVREIGRGGMSRVLLARNTTTGRRVAIKVISPDFSGGVLTYDANLDLFVREASVLSRLKHPRIVEVLDFGIQDKWPYLVLEFLPLINLDQLLEKSSPHDRIRLACRITSLVLEALDHAHSQGYVHRDVKPSNLLGYRDARNRKLHIKLGDFGLAKSFKNAGMSGITGSQEIRGTVVYMPPEQLLDSRAAGPLSDIYSTGATLYRLLSGCNPFESKHLSQLLSVVFNEEPQPIQSKVADIPEKLAAIVHRAMSKEPSERFSSAAEMRDELQPFGQKRL